MIVFVIVWTSVLRELLVGMERLKVLILYKLLGTENFWCCLSCVDAGLRHLAHILYKLLIQYSTKDLRCSLS